jgi:MFS transporter, DHA1 family, tetracycline resistance protein
VDRSNRTPLPPGFGVLWTTIAIDLIGFGIAVPVLALFAEREFGASPFQAAALFATFSLAQFVAAPVLGRLSDRIGRKPVILFSLFGTAVGAFITAGAGVLWVLFLGRALDGMTGASVSVAQAAATDLAPPEQRTRVLGLLGAAFGIGFTVGPAIGGLAAWLGGPRAPFVVAGVLALGNGLAAWVRLPETRRRGEVVAAAPWVRPGRLTQLVAVGFIATTAFAGFEATFSLLGNRRFDLTESSVSFLFVGIGVSQAFIQGMAISSIVARFGHARTLLIGLSCNVVGLLVLALATSWPLLIVALLLLVAGQGTASPSLSALVAGSVDDRYRGRALGLAQSGGALARVVGPAAAGVLFARVGVGAPSAIGAALIAIAVVMFVPLMRSTASARSESPPPSARPV